MWYCAHLEKNHDEIDWLGDCMSMTMRTDAERSETYSSS